MLLRLGPDQRGGPASRGGHQEDQAARDGEQHDDRQREFRDPEGHPEPCARPTLPVIETVGVRG